MSRARKPLTKDMVLAAMAKTKSNRAACRFLNVSYIHYKGYAKMYIDKETGKRFLSRDITAPSHGRKSGIYEWKGKFPAKGRMWAYTKANMEKLEAEGKLFYT